MRKPINFDYCETRDEFIEELSRYASLEPEIDYYLEISCRLLKNLLEHK